MPRSACIQTRTQRDEAVLGESLRMTEPDIVDAVAGLAPASPIATLRRQREAFVLHTQGSYDVLITPADPAGVSQIERAAAALRVASLERDAALIAHYGGRLRQIGADAATIEAVEQGREPRGATARLAAILHHVALVATAPGSSSRARLDALRNAGLTPRDIVTIAQIVAFVSYQVRVVAGLRALAQDSRA
jgi:CMD domain protein